MKTLPVLSLALLLVPSLALAKTRTSASYALTTETVDAGGARGTSASYSNRGSAGGVVGLSTVAAPVEVAKHGYIGQLYDIAGLAVTTAPTTVNEGGTRQLAAAQFLDDATTLPVNAAAVSWSVQSGPIASISSAGLVTAAIVYQDTAASVQGSYAGTTGSLGLTVLNVNVDDFGTYAGDQIDDAWQVQYFGVGNPSAAPGVDASGTGQTNLFKYVAGLNPIDPTSRFSLNIAPVVGQPTQMNLVFSPRLSDRTYTVTATPDLVTGSYVPLASSSTSDSGPQRTVTDLAATGARKFYRVEIAKP